MRINEVRWCSVWVFVASALGACNQEPERAPNAPAPSPTPPPTQAAVAEPAPAAPSPEPSPLEKLLMAKTLAEAIELVKPAMSDTDDETSPGALMLGLWAAEHLALADVAVKKNETSFALVRKDSDGSRGKRMCVRGTIIQIAKQQADDQTLWRGLLLSGYSDIASFIAVGSTGALVERSRARLCGVVIGTYDYSNSAGGKGHAVSLVGIFDLPENRRE